MSSYDEWKGRAPEDEPGYEHDPADDADDVLVDGVWVRAAMRRRERELTSLRIERDDARQQRDELILLLEEIHRLCEGASEKDEFALGYSTLKRIAAAITMAKGGAK